MEGRDHRWRALCLHGLSAGGTHFLLQVPSARDSACLEDFMGAVHLGMGLSALADLQPLEEGSLDSLPCSVFNQIKTICGTAIIPLPFFMAIDT